MEQVSITGDVSSPLGREYLDKVLTELVEKNGSDLHLKVSEPPVFRIDGKLTRTDARSLTADDTKHIVLSLMNEERRAKFRRTLELDMSYAVPDVARFRVNIFSQRGHLGAAMRTIPLHIKSIDEWQLPQVLKKLALLPRGFVLVTGPTGSGKSTTLAAMIEHINSNVRKHIVTIEDPIEFMHEDRIACIQQREIGVDTHSFADALKHVMRQNPDVILVGEMRDLETISLAITAAETGSLVLATLHTVDAAQTVDRIVDMFPPEQQQQVRLQLSSSLQAIISETLLPLVDGKGRIAAFEILMCTAAVRNVIREGKAEQIYSIIQSGAKFGMKLLDQALKELYLRGLVSYGDALAKSSNPQEFEESISRA